MERNLSVGIDIEARANGKDKVTGIADELRELSGVAGAGAPKLVELADELEKMTRAAGKPPSGAGTNLVLRWTRPVACSSRTWG